MLFLQGLIRPWSNPLDQMPFGNVGIHPFPVEIWEHIFALTADPIQYLVNGAQTYQYFFSEEEESHLWNFDALMVYSILFKTRLSIILTCRSWYHMGIPILWSHLLLKGGNIERDSSIILENLKRNATIGAYVTRISIFRLSQRDYSQKAKYILKLLPFLPKLSTVYGPVQVLEGFPSSLRVNSAVIRAIPTIGGYIPTIQRITFDDLFWRHCQALSLTSPLSALEYASGQSQVVFPSLISLRLCISEPEIFQWVISAWHFPVLKNLSVIIPKHSENRAAVMSISITPLFGRVRLKLERIQVPVMFVYSASDEEKVDFPRLTELHLLNMGEEKTNVLQFGNQIITAPNLRRVVLYAYFNLFHEESYWSRIFVQESRLWSTFPSSKEIDIIAPRGEWVAPGHYKPNELVAKIEDVIYGLCRKNSMVRIMWGATGNVKVFEGFVGDRPERYQAILDQSVRLVIRDMK